MGLDFSLPNNLEISMELIVIGIMMKINLTILLMEFDLSVFSLPLIIKHIG
jgi:hypothetical protein